MGSKSKTTSENQSSNTLSNYSRNQIDQSKENVRGILDNAPSAGLTTQEQQAQEQFMQTQGQGQGLFDQAASIAQSVGGYQPQTLADFSEADRAAYQNPFTQQVIDANTNDIRRQGDIAQAGVNADATSAGAFGGSRHGVQAAQMEDDTQDRLASMSAALRSEGYNQMLSQFNADQDRQLQSQSLQLQNAGLLGNIGGLVSDNNRANAGLLAQFGATEYDRANNDALNRAQIELGLGQLTPLEWNTTGSGTSTTKQGANWGQLLGTGVQAAGLLSDRRLKANVKFSHERDGRKYYSFRYVWDNPIVRRIGLMAQDLLKSEPERVHIHSSGYLMVDYSGLEA